MRTCQSIYQECSRVLYTENTAGVCFHDKYQVRAHQHGEVLGRAFEGKDWLYRRPPADEPNMGTEYMLSAVKPPAHGLSRFESALNAVARFSRIQVVIHAGPGDMRRLAFWICRALHEVLQDRHVTFVLQPYGRHPSIEAKELYGCSILECRSIKVVGCEVTSRVKRLLNGPNDVEDICRRWLMLMDAIGELPTLNELDFFDHFENAVSSLENYAYGYQKNKYLEMERFLVSYAAKWRASWHNDNVQKAQQRVDHATKCMEEAQKVTKEFQKRLETARDYAAKDEATVADALAEYSTRPELTFSALAAAIKMESPCALDGEHGDANLTLEATGYDDEDLSEIRGVFESEDDS